MNKIKVEWAEIHYFVKQVAIKYKDCNITGVYGLPRGGLIPAVMLSHTMNVPLLMAPVPRCLIVDDICDSGESLLHYFRNSSGCGKCPWHIVTIAYTPNDNNVEPEFYIMTKEDSWLVFPWEDEHVSD